MNRNILVGLTIILAGITGWSSTAAAQSAANIGGRTSITANLSVATTKPDVGEDFTALVLGALGAYTTESGRFEVGGGLTILGLFSDAVDGGIYNLTGQARVNSNPLGPEENVLVYLGGVVGVSFIDFDGFSDEIGIFGPKVGAEFYISPNTAIQIEDTFVGDTEGGVSNTLTVGFKLLFQ